MSKKMTYLVAETGESMKGLSATRLNETVTADKVMSNIQLTLTFLQFFMDLYMFFLSYHKHICAYTCVHVKFMFCQQNA